MWVGQFVVQVGGGSCGFSDRLVVRVGGGSCDLSHRLGYLAYGGMVVCLIWVCELFEAQLSMLGTSCWSLVAGGLQ